MVSFVVRISSLFQIHFLGHYVLGRKLLASRDVLLCTINSVIIVIIIIIITLKKSNKVTVAWSVGFWYSNSIGRCSAHEINRHIKFVDLQGKALSSSFRGNLVSVVVIEFFSETLQLSVCGVRSSRHKKYPILLSVHWFRNFQYGLKYSCLCCALKF